MTYTAPQSRCCQAPVRTDGGPSTWFWRCTRCGEPCDAEPVPPETWQLGRFWRENPMIYPTITTLPHKDGSTAYRVEIPGLSIEHGQAWQAEALFQQQATARGIELPEEWFERRLGERSMPAA